MKPIILFRWSDSRRASSDNRDTVAQIIRAHRKGQRAGQRSFVRYDRATHTVEVGHHDSTVYGIFTRL